VQVLARRADFLARVWDRQSWGTGFQPKDRQSLFTCYGLLGFVLLISYVFIKNKHASKQVIRIKRMFKIACSC